MLLIIILLITANLYLKEIQSAYGDFQVLFYCIWKLDKRIYWSLSLNQGPFWIGSIFWVLRGSQEYFFLATLIITSSKKKKVANLFKEVQVLGLK